MIVTLIDSRGREVVNLPDPGGGSFDAAGDFDRLIGLAGSWRMWNSVNEFGDLSISADLAAQLLLDISELMVNARAGRERRGLTRLETLARECTADPGARLVFHGD